MARTDKFREVPRYCVQCGGLIPGDRRIDAVCCSKECSKARKDWQRSREDAQECRYCHRASSPEERERYKAWRRWEAKGVADSAETNAKLVREVIRLKRKLAELQPPEVSSGDVDAQHS